MRSNESPSSPGNTNNKNVYNQSSPSPVNVNVPQPNMSVGIQSAHTSVQHSVPLNMGIPPNGVVVTYNNPPPPFVPPTTQSQQGILNSFVFLFNFCCYKVKHNHIYIIITRSYSILEIHTFFSI